MFEGPVQDLIDELGKLPGIGPKSAQRIAFHMLSVEPPEIDRLTYTGANDIERILSLCETLIDNIIKAFRYTGAAECAAGGLI